MVVRKKSRKAVTPKKRGRVRAAPSPEAKAGLKTFKEFEKKVNAAWDRLRKDVRQRNRSAILKGRNDLMLLLGECDFISREYMRNLSKFRRA